MTTNIATRQLGSATVSVVSAGKSHWKPHFPEGEDWTTPDTPTDELGRGIFGVNTLVIQIGERIIVVDPASFPPDEDSLGDGSLVVPGPSLGTSLENLGIDPAAVTDVVVTHLHLDHFTGLLDGDEIRFPNADHYLPKADWEAFVVRGEGARTTQIRPILHTVERSAKLHLVEGDLDLGDGLSVLHTPGESPGHQVIRFESGGERVYYTGDLLHFPIEFQRLDWAPHPNTSDALRGSRLRVFEDSTAARSLVVMTHGLFPAWGFVDGDRDAGFRWRYESESRQESVTR